ncbi:MAG: GNAT family N-acetyltransferase [Hyphomicrobiales bacterium]
MTEFVIVPADDGSGPGLATLISSVFSEYEGCPFVDDEFKELDAVSTHYRRLGGEIWIARPADDPARSHLIIGCLAIVPTQESGVFALFKMYLAQDARGTGLAQRLYGEALRWARVQGMHTLRLWTDTRFASGHRFYEKLGFAKQPVVRYLGDAGQSWEYLFICNAPKTPS